MYQILSLQYQQKAGNLGVILALILTESQYTWKHKIVLQKKINE